MKLFKTMLVLGGAGLLAGILFIYFGLFNVAADDPHTKPAYWLMETVRERSVAMRARRIEAPPLKDPAMIIAGGADFNEMCTGCHLKPGVEDSEMASAMYPRPPNLAKATRDNPAETFWIIKHGLKMSGMPAWGPTHDDERIWAMVAFLLQLPRLTPAQYQILTTRGEGDAGEHKHGGTDTPRPAPAHTEETESARPSHEKDEPTTGTLPSPDPAAIPAGELNLKRDALGTITVYKSRDCDCCNRWVKRLRQADITVDVRNESSMTAVKARLGVPPALAACHTAVVGNYLIEGHVPAADIRRLLAEKPPAKGLAVPGIPVGSPGMEQGKHQEPYSVLLFRSDGSSSVYARHGAR